MYRVKKVLNHNSVIALHADNNREYLIMGRGAGFGKKVSERIETRPEDVVYSLHEVTDRGDARELVKTISPICLELANEILNRAEQEFGKIDRRILFPMADHIEYAVRRIKNNEQISNPLTEDIQVLFYKEYKVAMCMEKLLLDNLGVQIDEHEVGYIALHIHSAIEDEKVSQAMLIAGAVRECISRVEEHTGKKIDVLTLSYNRLMNHVRYMVARALNGEKLKVNMNDYMEIKFPKAFEISRTICEEVGHSIHRELDEVEIGYLAMHIERVVNDEMES